MKKMKCFLHKILTLLTTTSKYLLKDIEENGRLHY
jgi:hypothetical protein